VERFDYDGTPVALVLAALGGTRAGLFVGAAIGVCHGAGRAFALLRDTRRAGVTEYMRSVLKSMYRRRADGLALLALGGPRWRCSPAGSDSRSWLARRPPQAVVLKIDGDFCSPDVQNSPSILRNDASEAGTWPVASLSVTAEAPDVTAEALSQAGAARPASRPVIGISTYAEQARWGNWDKPALLLPRRYADAVAEAGGVPVLLPPLPVIEQAAGRLDGLILSGGGDIHPAEFGAVAHPETNGIRPERDTAEFALVSAALALGLPLLGICRGLQVLNVALGGTLHQHLPALVGHDGHSPKQGIYSTHPVRITPGTRLASILTPGDDVQRGAGLDVPTHHHQAIDQLGKGLVATAWADDGVVEAVELASPPANGSGPSRRGFVLAVQWHPEAGDDPRLFQALVAAAQSTASRPAPVSR
jgi:putative glutamine amidotransferase